MKKETVRERQKRQTRALILETARTLFATKGFQETTIRTIASEAGIGLGTVFNYFPDKTALLVAALLDDLANVGVAAMESCPGDVCFLDKFLHFSKQYYSYYASNIALSRTLIKEMLFVEGECAISLREQLYQYLMMLSGMIQEDQSLAENLKGQDTMLVAECLFSNYYAVLLMGLSAEEFGVDIFVNKLKKMASFTLNGA